MVMQKLKIVFIGYIFDIVMKNIPITQLEIDIIETDILKD